MIFSLVKRGKNKKMFMNNLKFSKQIINYIVMLINCFLVTAPLLL